MKRRTHRLTGEASARIEICKFVNHIHVSPCFPTVTRRETHQVTGERGSEGKTASVIMEAVSQAD